MSEGFGGAGATVRWLPPSVLLVMRDPARGASVTLGTMSAAGLIPALATLELPWRDNRVAISCIPEGDYRITMAYSARYSRAMPRLLGVPGREGILVHAGNNRTDTEGCILVGMARGEDGRTVVRSREALGLVVRWLTVATADGGEALCRIGRAA